MNQEHKGIGDNVARDKIVINFVLDSNKLEEYISFLNYKANEVNRKLSLHYAADLAPYLNEFNHLHLMHVDCLRKHNFIQAHDMLFRIIELSQEIQHKFTKKLKLPKIDVYHCTTTFIRPLDYYGYTINLYLIKGTFAEFIGKDIKVQDSQADLALKGMGKEMQLQQSILPNVHKFRTRILEEMKRHQAFAAEICKLEEIKKQYIEIRLKSLPNLFQPEINNENKNEMAHEKFESQLKLVENQLVDSFLDYEPINDSTLKTDLMTQINKDISEIIELQK
jgi:hypothetical protein